jgi:cAMP phosphodiesterase
MAPLVANEQLKAIFIEVSFANGRPDQLLFGHLTPDWLLKELRVLSDYRPMTNVKIVVTHIKPEKEARAKIIDQLNKGGAGHYTFVFPQQGDVLWL